MTGTEEKPKKPRKLTPSQARALELLAADPDRRYLDGLHITDGQGFLEPIAAGTYGVLNTEGYVCGEYRGQRLSEKGKRALKAHQKQRG